MKKAATEPKLYQIEKNVPLPARSTPKTLQEAINKVDEQVQKMRVGDSMPILRKNKTSVMKYLKTHYPENQFSFSDIKPDNKFTRFWLRK